MKKTLFIMLGLSISTLHTKQTVVDHKKAIRDQIEYLEQNGGNPITEQELQEIKQKAQDITNPTEARRLTLKVGMRILERSLLAEESDHQLIDQITPEDIAVAIEGITYLRGALDTFGEQLTITLGTVTDQEQYSAQLYHALAYVLTLILEVEKSLEKIEFRVKANKEYEEASAIFKLHIAPADIIQQLYRINGGIYEKIPVM